MKLLPKEYAWLHKEKLPPILDLAFNFTGLLEGPGNLDNPVILDWARELGGYQKDIFTHDSVPWCGLFMAYITTKAGYKPPKKWEAAISWRTFGVEAPKPGLGDIMVLSRKGGNHVAQYVCEDTTHYHLHGANQSNAVNISKFPKSRLVSARRPDLSIPARQIFKSPVGKVSTSEA